MQFGVIIFLILPSTIFAQKTKELTEEDLKTWWQKDVQEDTIPGISLDKAYRELLNNKIGQEVIVAVLDTKIDIDHEDLKDQIWVNSDEIPNNNIDDDKNGYIDDINGWNFLGNAKGGEVSHQSVELLRVIHKYESTYGVSKEISVPTKEVEVEYEKALEEFESQRLEMLDAVDYVDSIANIYNNYKIDIVALLDGKTYNEMALDSLLTIATVDKDNINWMKSMIDWGIEEDGVKSYIDHTNKELNTTYNKDFNERKYVDGGNNKVKENSMPFQHSTPVSGVLAATRTNDLGVQGFSDAIRIMPVVMVAHGDEHDEDVAKAIRYAVDNGAQIINMSWVKYYSTQTELVRAAFEYAAKKNVLLVTGSGNDSKDIDVELSFPTDFYLGEEIMDNFINTGGTTSQLDSTIVAEFSNYGKKQVDIFSPAKDIFSSAPDNEYNSRRGTSFASPIVAGTAALLLSYFPQLTAIQLKEIILKSGTKLDILVNRPGDEDGAALVPFSELSKTGSILNVYAAIQMAMELKK